MDELSASATRVAEELRRRGISTNVVEMPESTRSAAEAAAAIGCDISQIVKSLVFRSVPGDAPVLVLASGADRVDEDRLAHLVGPVEQAPAKFVRARTGFAIGGVPPIGHAEAIETFLEEHLLDHDVVWAAAGTPRAVFSIEPRDLVALTSAKVVALAAAR
ncbi:MAG TPA: YbaK/EbsC family protein [Acidimicrobiales bacterium]|nr:YbaK/EbsC family protein [Acidimicrobiales bacterium]